jgi:hypothetical protein
MASQMTIKKGAESNQVSYGCLAFRDYSMEQFENAETNGTCHVAYRKDEFDMVAIFKPSPTLELQVLLFGVFMFLL